MYIIRTYRRLLVVATLKLNPYRSSANGCFFFRERKGSAAGGLVPFRVGFDDVINNELLGVFIRNDTNSEVIKLRSLGLPGGATERENVCVRSQIPSLGSKRDFSLWTVKKSEKWLLLLQLQRRGRADVESREPGKGFLFRGTIRSTNRVNHPWLLQD